MTVEEGIEYLSSKVVYNEPVFILRGRDLLAADIVLSWAQRAELNGVGEQKVCDAIKVSAAMREWTPARLPD